MKPILSATLSVSGTVLTDNEKYLLEEANPMGVTLFKRNIESFEQVSALTRSIKEVIGRNNVMIAVDQEGGQTSRFDPPLTESFLAQYSIGMLPPYERMEATSLQAHLISDVLYKAGVNLNYAPCVDVLHEETGAVLKSRCFSEDEKKVTDLGKKMLQTYHENGVIACLKHAPGHGRAYTDPHLSLPIIDKNVKELQKDFYPFKMLSSVAVSMMTAHILLPQIDNKPVTQSKKIIQDIIRDEIGFSGFLISDAIDMKALKGSLSEKVKNALEAGCDAVCYCMGEKEGVAEVLKSADYLRDKSLERFQKMKEVMKFFDAPIKVDENLIQAYQEILSSAPLIEEDYDAVEVLNQLKPKKNF